VTMMFSCPTARIFMAVSTSASLLLMRQAFSDGLVPLAALIFVSLVVPLNVNCYPQSGDD
jgi:hypothetical protein